MIEETLSKPTFVRRLTSLAPAAIAVLELTGPRALSMVMQCWEPASPFPIRLNQIRYGKTKNSSASEDIVVAMTAADTFELHCHGGRFAAERIIEDLVAVGAHECSIDDRPMAVAMDSWSATAWRDLERTTTTLTTAIMLHQANGALSRAIQEIEALVEAKNWTEALKKIELLLERSVVGKHLLEPWKLAIVGPPNVGKSSLLNAILGFDRAIVAPTAGTTRDVLNERTSLLGWSFEILDTAGIRDSVDTVESEGVQLALDTIEQADLGLCLIDPTVGWTAQHDLLAKAYRWKLLMVVSKADLSLLPPNVHGYEMMIKISARTGAGLSELYQAIVSRLVPPELGLTNAADGFDLEDSELGDVRSEKLPEQELCKDRAVPHHSEQIAYLELLKAKVLDRFAGISKLD